jgi:hypothetical protein
VELLNSMASDLIDGRGTKTGLDSAVEELLIILEAPLSRGGVFGVLCP